MDKGDRVNLPIGVFDSGLGGLTVVRAIKRILPQESIIYLGDTAHLPYGTKSSDSIIKFSFANTKFLINQGVKAIVVACNTSSATALKKLKEHFSIPIFGVIEPGSRSAVEISKKGKIGVIGTTATIRSKAYQRELKSLKPSIDIYAKACPLFVPLIEEGWVDNEVTYKVAEIYLNELKRHGIDTLILGCTHYPLIKETIQKIMGKDVILIDSGESVALWLKNFLKKKKILAKNKNPFYYYYLTDFPQRFKKIAERFLGEKIIIKKINLG